MKHMLKLRPVNHTDIGSDLRFLPEKEEVEIYLSSIETEINAIEFLLSVKKVGSVFYLESLDGISQDRILEMVKPIISGDVTNFVRFVSLE